MGGRLGWLGRWFWGGGGRCALGCVPVWLSGLKRARPATPNPPSRQRNTIRSTPLPPPPPPPPPPRSSRWTSGCGGWGVRCLRFDREVGDGFVLVRGWGWGCDSTGLFLFGWSSVEVFHRERGQCCRWRVLHRRCRAPGSLPAFKTYHPGFVLNPPQNSPALYPLNPQPLNPKPQPPTENIDINQAPPSWRWTWWSLMRRTKRRLCLRAGE